MKVAKFQEAVKSELEIKNDASFHILVKSEQMAENKLDKDFWNNKYKNEQTGWDLGQVSPPLKTFIDGLQDKSQRILIPGAGNAYELGYLLEEGFENVTIIDIAPKLIEELKKRYDTSKATVIEGDFFAFDGTFDLILEQTFFCAIDPDLRDDYVKQMHKLLAPKGRLCGVLFDRSFEGGPPFGGNREEYKQRFGELFNIQKLEACRNSHPARDGAEVWIEVVKE